MARNLEDIELELRTAREMSKAYQDARIAYERSGNKNKFKTYIKALTAIDAYNLPERPAPKQTTDDISTSLNKYSSISSLIESLTEYKDVPNARLQIDSWGDIIIRVSGTRLQTPAEVDRDYASSLYWHVNSCIETLAANQRKLSKERKLAVDILLEEKPTHEALYTYKKYFYQDKLLTANDLRAALALSEWTTPLVVKPIVGKAVTGCFTYDPVSVTWTFTENVDAV